MGEALLIKTGGQAVGSNNSSQNIASNGMITEIFTTSTLWKVPENLRNNQVTVRIFGGGGSAVGMFNGGAGGYMANSVINVTSNEEIYIHIGEGGKRNNNTSFIGSVGGTTSFGTYLYAFGGGGNNMQDGGSGGGAGMNQKFGGVGKQFGGGGGSANNSTIGYSIGGNGGYWGGGGGGYIYNTIGNSSIYNNSGRGGVNYYDLANYYINGISGLGGNGAIDGTKSDSTNNLIFRTAKNGTNTIGLGLDFEGYGRARVNYVDGGGGYGGNGGVGISGGFGGGGGYGGNGGNGNGYGGGGGGGYGADGGGAGQACGGGGGGYGKHGHGGGYHNINGVNTLLPAGIAAGGYCKDGYRDGGDGICIIQYYLE